MFNICIGIRKVYLIENSNVIIYKKTYFAEKIIVSLTHQIVSHIFTKIAFKLLRTNLFHIVFFSIFLIVGTSKLHSQEKPKKIVIPSTKNTDKTIDSLSISEIKISKLGDHAGVLGACLLSRGKILGMI